MKEKIQALIKELMEQNQERDKRLNSKPLTEYGHTALIHEYSNTLDIIKKLELIIKN